MAPKTKQHQPIKPNSKRKNKKLTTEQLEQAALKQTAHPQRTQNGILLLQESLAAKNPGSEDSLNSLTYLTDPVKLHEIANLVLEDREAAFLKVKASRAERQAILSAILRGGYNASPSDRIASANLISKMEGELATLLGGAPGNPLKVEVDLKTLPTDELVKLIETTMEDSNE